MEQQNLIPARADMAAVATMHSQWLEYVSQNSGDLCIDCSQVEFFGAAAAQLLVATSKMLQSSGRELKLQNISQALCTDLMMLGLPEYQLQKEKA